MEQSITDGLKSLYKSALENDRAELIQKFGASFFKQSIFERVKSYEDACKELNLPTDLPYTLPTNSRQRAVNAMYMLDIINQALLDGAELDWEDSDQRKWYPFFTDYKPGFGFRFVDADFVWAYANSNGGARLCLDTQEKAKYFGTQFLAIWNDFNNPNK